MSPRDRARQQLFRDEIEAILEDVYRELWADSSWWRREQRKRVSRSPLRIVKGRMRLSES